MIHINAEGSLRLCMVLVALLILIHLLTGGRFLDAIIEIPLIFFFILYAISKIPMIWVTFLVVFSLRSLKK